MTTPEPRVPRPMPDDGWTDALGDAGDGGLEFLDDAHLVRCSSM
jgi:hypothetical protein